MQQAILFLLILIGAAVVNGALLRNGEILEASASSNGKACNGCTMEELRRHAYFAPMGRRRLETNPSDTANVGDTIVEASGELFEESTYVDTATHVEPEEKKEEKPSDTVNVGETFVEASGEILEESKYADTATQVEPEEKKQEKKKADGIMPTFREKYNKFYAQAVPVVVLGALAVKCLNSFYKWLFPKVEEELLSCEIRQERVLKLLDIDPLKPHHCEKDYLSFKHLCGPQYTFIKADLIPLKQRCEDLMSA